MKLDSLFPCLSWAVPGRLLVPSIALLLAACGGGGEDGGGSSGTGSGSGTASVLPSQYAVYAYGQAQATAGAGAVAAGMLDLGAGQRTQLASVGTDGGVSASNENFNVVSRLDGAVLMLCDPAGFAGGADPTRFVAIALQGGVGAPQQITRATDLIGLRFHRLRGCALVNHQDAPQGRSDNPDAQTKTYTVNSDGSLSVSSGATLSATQFQNLVSGGPVNLGEGTDRLTVYRFTVNGQSRHFAVSWFVPTAPGAGAADLSLWLPQ